MKRVRTRVIAATLAVLFAQATAAELFAFHACPHHGDGGRRARGADVAPETAAGHAGESHAATATDRGDHRHAGGDDDHGPCGCFDHCLGHCAAGPAVSAGALEHAPEIDAASRSRRSSAERTVRSAVSYLLPFANAPPLV